MKDPPSGRVPGRAPERFLVATEACGGGTPDLSSPWMFLGDVVLYRRKKSVREPRGDHEGGGAPMGAGAPPCLVATSNFR